LEDEGEEINIKRIERRKEKRDGKVGNREKIERGEWTPWTTKRGKTPEGKTRRGNRNSVHVLPVYGVHKRAL
jgi:hypothetical protein